MNILLVQFHSIHFALFSSAPGRLHGVRLAHCQYGSVFIGSTTYDSLTDQSHFSLNRVSSSHDWAASRSIYGLKSGFINDFSFGSFKENTIAFAFGGERERGLHILDLENGQLYSAAYSYGVDSEALCVQMNWDGRRNLLMSGHRNGSFALIDCRSKDPRLVINSDGDFGSAATVLKLEKNEHLFLVRGSFGSCRVFDIRRLQSNKRKYSKHQQPTVLKLLPPANVHNTKSSNCTGLAVHPTESVVVAPYATKQNEMRAALWSVENGQLLRTAVLESSSTLSTPGDCPMFCELKASATPGFRLGINELGTPTVTCDSWGIWYKSWSASRSLPVDAGSIQHMIFD
jgi:hypothetical protein